MRGPRTGVEIDIPKTKRVLYLKECPLCGNEFELRDGIFVDSTDGRILVCSTCGEGINGGNTGT